jgi:hypothetical protein
LALDGEVLALKSIDSDWWEAVCGGVGKCMVELLSELRLMFEEARTGLSVDFASLVEFVWHFVVCCVEVMVLDRA